MSNSDSFIAEVTEEVRRDRLYQTFRRFGWIAIALVLLLVGGAAWREYSKSLAAAAAQAQGDAILTALETPDDTARAAAMTGLSVPGPAAAITALLAAAEQQKSGDVAAAVLTLDQMAGAADVDPLYRDLAQLKSLMLQVGTGDPAVLKQGLGTLAAPGAPFRLLAQEQIAMVDLGAGDTAAALTVLKQGLGVLAAPGAPFRLLAQEQIAMVDLQAGDTGAALTGLAAIAADAQVTSGLRDRVNGLIVALGGDLAEAAPAADIAPAE